MTGSTQNYSLAMSFETFNLLPNPGEVHVVYKVTNDPTTSLNGFYHWNGANYIFDHEPDNTNNIVPGENRSAKAGAVADYALSRTNHKAHLATVKDNFLSIYNGVDSKSVFLAPITLGAAGDFIEFRVKPLNLAANHALGIIGEPGYNTSTIGFSTTGALYVRNSAGAWLTTVGFLANIIQGEDLVVRLEWDGSQIKTYKNGIFQKNITNGSLILQNIGSAYNVPTELFNGYFGALKIKFGATTIDFSNPFDNNFFTNTNVSLLVTDQAYLTSAQWALIQNTANLVIPQPNCFYQFSLNASSTGNEQFIVYRKMKSGHYCGFIVEHEIIAGERKNVWRIVKANTYTYNGVAMTLALDSLISYGENESVYKTTGASDFTGGWHGDEITTGVEFFADGFFVPINAAIGLTACEDFRYQVKSNLLRTDVAPDTVEAVHEKITFFESGGYRTFNRLTWLLVSNIERWYLGISCIGKIAATSGNNEYLQSANFTATLAQVLDKVDSREFYAKNPANNLSVYATSKLLKPSNRDAFCNVFIWDRVPDSKYYRNFVPVSNPQIGEVWESEMIIDFTKK